MKKIFISICSCLFLLVVVMPRIVVADVTTAYELYYDEQEPGTGIYRTRYLLTENYLRIDEPGEDSGYILFDNSKSTIYSVTHYDRSILVIRADAYRQPDLRDRISVNYRVLPEAPKISSRPVYNYRVVTGENKTETCVDIQLVEGLLPDVTRMLRAYQKVVASQQAKLVDNTPREFQTTCFLYDQVFNEGLYYDKGLPIQEWHSNHKTKMLSGYKTIEVDSGLFVVPDDYKQYSVD